MLTVYPLAPEKTLPYPKESVYRETFQGKPSVFENPRHQNLRTSARTHSNPLIPFLMTRFPPGFHYSPEHVGIVKKLREIYEELVRNSTSSTYEMDYCGKPSGVKRKAEAYPKITGRDIYKAPRYLESIVQQSYRGEPIPRELRVAAIPFDSVARRGMMPMMYPHGNTQMETLSEVQDQFSSDPCRRCLGKNDRRVKPKGPPTKEPILCRDYVPVPMQPIA